ncbi:hypothetical protein KKF84_06100 [Myxococcota bacterium]|nr:hypothetical protein [Myxococcota bacterium]
MSKAMYLADEFRPRATIRGGTAMFAADDAIALVQEAHKQRIIILGIDTFRLTEKATEPMMDHILDLSTRGFFADDDWGQSIQFIQERAGQGFHFEIVLGDAIEIGRSRTR